MAGAGKRSSVLPLIPSGISGTIFSTPYISRLPEHGGLFVFRAGLNMV
jgi:hypothetical protein